MGVKEEESEERIQREITQKVERKKEGGKGVNDISSDPDANLILVLASPFAATLRDANLCINIPSGREWIGERYSLSVAQLGMATRF